MKPLCILFLLMLLFSCTKKDNKYGSAIIGEWKFIKEIDSTAQEQPLPPPPPFKAMSNFEVLNDSVFKSFFGYEADSKSGEKVPVRYNIYKTSYKIEGDSMMVLIPTIKKWRRAKIYSLKRDTLIYETEPKKYTKFVRQHYHTNPDEKYDAIIVSSSPCYGSCPIADIYISRNGDVFYSGTNYNLKNGNYTAKITSKKYDELEQDFKKAGIDTLKTHYDSPVSDSQTITVTFIKNGAIYKTISDYAGQSPEELQWGYTQARYLCQVINLSPTKLHHPGLMDGYIGFDSDRESYSLFSSEQFYLITELEKAKETKQSFTKKYTVQYGAYERKKFIETDGRYYKFPKSDGGKTIDLGYNFIERNGIDRRRERKAGE